MCLGWGLGHLLHLSPWDYRWLKITKSGNTGEENNLKKKKKRGQGTIIFILLFTYLSLSFLIKLEDSIYQI